MIKKLRRLLCPFKWCHRYKNPMTVNIKGKTYITCICKRCGKVLAKELKEIK